MTLVYSFFIVKENVIRSQTVCFANHNPVSTQLTEWTEISPPTFVFDKIAMEPTFTGDNCHGDTCQGHNICPAVLTLLIWVKVLKINLWYQLL